METCISKINVVIEIFELFYMDAAMYSAEKPCIILIKKHLKLNIVEISEANITE